MTDFFSMYLLPGTLALIMWGMGLSLKKEDFTRIIRKPKTILTGLFSQMIALPFIAFFLMKFSNLDPFEKVGFVLIAACPGGTSSNLVTHILKGRLALAVSLSSVNSMLILISLPIIVNLGLKFFVGESADIGLPVWDTISHVFFVIAIPVLIGMTVRYFKREWAVALEKPLRYLMTFLLLTVFVVVIFFDSNEESATVSDYINLLPWAVALNVLSMLAGWFIALLMRLGPKNSYTISIEVGLQNSALAIYVASVLLGNHKMAVVAVIYSSFTFFTTTALAYFLRRVTNREKGDTSKIAPLERERRDS